MKKAIISSFLLFSTTAILADTTMCFKENHSSMATIESVALDGGACEGKYSINDMKNKGWSVDDIKITQNANSMSFIYILKSSDHPKNAPMLAGAAGGTISGNLSQEQMEANIMAKLEAKKEAEEKVKLEEELKAARIDAQTLYVNNCQSCHGEKGEISKTSFRAIKNLSVEDMEEMLKDYKLGRGEKASSIYGPAHVNYLNDKAINGIKAYLDEINR